MNEKKLVLCQGLIASGKTTWALNEVKENGAVRFNKDDLRKELFPDGYIFSKENENIIIKKERDLVEISMLVLGDEYIIVDNTHLNHKDGTENKHILFYKDLAKQYNYEVEIKKFFITKEEAIKRDSIRAKDDRVGEEVINKMAKIYEIPTNHSPNPLFRKWNYNLPTCIIVDIDGTLAFMNGKRSPYDYSKVNLDTVNFLLLDLIDLIKCGDYLKTFIVSGRKDECKEGTIKWLNNNCVSYDKLYMRKNDDNRYDSIVKEEIYREHIEGKYNVLAVFDDRNRVVDKWRELGLPTYQVWYGDF